MKDAKFSANRLLELYDRISDAEDTIPRLRRFVLDLAVRGKLVDQDAGDEPASELLKRIAQEKARLVKAGEIKEAKQISLTKNADTSCPVGWQVVPLGEVINSHLGGGTPSKNNHAYWGGNIRWASVKDVGKTKYLDETIDRITEEGLANSSSNLIPLGNLIVVTRMGLGQLSINRVAVAINQDLRALFLSPFLDIDFIYNFFLTYGMEGTGLTVKGIKLDELLGIAFPLPPLAEQHRIVAKVDELMALCDQLEQARAGREAVRDRMTTASLARLTAPETDEEAFQSHARFALQSLPTLTTRPDQIKTLRQTILNLAVRGKLVEQDPTDEPAAELLERIVKAQVAACASEGLRSRPAVRKLDRGDLWFEFPESWALASFDELFVIVSGVTKGQKIAPGQAVEVPYLRVANVQRGHLDLNVIKSIVASKSDAERYLLRVGDVLMTEGGDWDKLGRAAIWRNEISGCIHQNHIFRVRPPSSDVLPEWVVTYTNSLIGRAFFEDASKQTTNLASINMTQLRGCPFPLPPLAEQHRIVAKVDALMALCDRLESSLTTATTTRSRLLDALLHEALDGAAA